MHMYYYGLLMLLLHRAAFAAIDMNLARNVSFSITKCEHITAADTSEPLHTHTHMDSVTSGRHMIAPPED